MDKLFVEDGGKYTEASDKDVLMVASFAAKRMIVPGIRLTGNKSAKEFLIPLLAAKDYEVFCVAYLDPELELIAFEELFRGTIDQVPAYPRDVFKRGMELNAYGVVLVHNHPSGNSDPSDADVMTTLRMKVVGDILKIKVLEHYVVSKKGIHGIMEEGDMSPDKLMKLMMQDAGVGKDESIHHIEIDGDDIQGGLAKLMEKLEKEIGGRRRGKKSLN